MKPHNQKTDVSPYFDHLDLTNEMVPLMMLSVSCDADAGSNDITWLKKVCCTLFWLSWPGKNVTVPLIMPVLITSWTLMPVPIASHNWKTCCTMVPLMMESTSCDTNAGSNSITLPRTSCWPNKCNSALDDAVSITWCQNWCQ